MSLYKTHQLVLALVYLQEYALLARSNLVSLGSKEQLPKLSVLDGYK